MFNANATVSNKNKNNIKPSLTEIKGAKTFWMM